MDRENIKRILMSMRTHENESKVNNLLGKIDMVPDDKLQEMIDAIGGSEEKAREVLMTKISPNTSEHTKINSMFSYGVNGNTVHLHLPVDLRDSMKKMGLRKTIAMVNLHMLDAIEKIRAMQKDGFYRFQGVDEIYMISPALINTELDFLSDLDFETQVLKRKELKDDSIVSSSPNHRLAREIFGADHNVGCAKISMEKVNSKEWQEKRKAVIDKYALQGISLGDESVSLE